MPFGRRSETSAQVEEPVTQRMLEPSNERSAEKSRRRSRPMRSKAAIRSVGLRSVGDVDDLITALDLCLVRTSALNIIARRTSGALAGPGNARNEVVSATRLNRTFHVLESGVGLVETLKNQLARLAFALRLCPPTDFGQ